MRVIQGVSEYEKLGTMYSIYKYVNSGKDTRIGVFKTITPRPNECINGPVLFRNGGTYHTLIHTFDRDVLNVATCYYHLRKMMLLTYIDKMVLNVYLPNTFNVDYSIELNKDTTLLRTYIHNGKLYTYHGVYYRIYVIKDNKVDDYVEYSCVDGLDFVVIHMDNIPYLLLSNQTKKDTIFFDADNTVINKLRKHTLIGISWNDYKIKYVRINDEYDKILPFWQG